MNDQEGTASAQARDEQQQQQARQPERGSGGGGGGGSHNRERGRRRHAQNQPPRRSETQLPMEELRDLFALFTEHGLTEFELERESFRVHLGRNLSPPADATAQPQVSSAQPVILTPMPAPESGARPDTGANAPAASPVGTQAEQATAEEESLHIITSPIVGTFYRSPSPTAEPFVRLGSHVNSDTVVCIIEAMKLMNEIQAEASGEIAKIYVENGQPVEYGQPLFGVKK